MRGAWIIMVFVAMLTGCGRERGAPVLLFSGAGSSPSDVRAIAALLRERDIDFEMADSYELDAMSLAELRARRLIIVPGGNFEEMGNHLHTTTSANIRAAVQGGTNYLGICGGAFIAGDSPYNGFNLTNGVRFPFYSAENRGIRKAAVAISSPDGSTLEHYWEDGPELGGWGAPVARYPDGTPAIAQGTVGNGWVILSGVHPEAPQTWRGEMPFATPVSADHEYAMTLIDAALNGKPLPHF